MKGPVGSLKTGWQVNQADNSSVGVTNLFKENLGRKMRWQRSGAATDDTNPKSEIRNPKSETNSNRGKRENGQNIEH
jgi:hypothetical protein